MRMHEPRMASSGTTSASSVTDAVFLSGVYLMILGIFVAYAKYLGSLVWHKLTQQLYVTVRVSSKDESFLYVSSWLAEHKYSKTARNVKMETSYPASRGRRRGIQKGKPRILLVPAEGQHLLEFNGKWLWISRTTSQSQGNTNQYRERGGNSMMEQEQLSISFLALPFFTDPEQRQQLVLDLVEQTKDAWFRKEEGKTTIYCSNGESWRRMSSRANRNLSSVVLEENLADQLANDAKEFMASHQWYMERGIPYRRGYLLYGPPGCGKTSFILALAAEIEAKEIYVVNLGDPLLSDSGLNTLMNSAGAPGSIMLFEDIDAAFVDRKAGEDKKNSVTFSGLLNALDGVYSQEGRLLFMTTNHRERLNPALIRPGRVDVQRKFDLATRYQLKGMFNKFYKGKGACSPSVSHDTIQEACQRFVSSFEPRTVSTAAIQGFLLRHRNDPLQAATKAALFAAHEMEKREEAKRKLRQEQREEEEEEEKKEKKGKQDCNDTFKETNLTSLAAGERKEGINNDFAASPLVVF